ncbi:MAG: inorganic pyrophosphatase [Defluviitaleaceae bacterium]|nr:inorganic pyrophosphatase [Defluviitaleaceae bacterium]
MKDKYIHDYLGKITTITIDRQIGTPHPKHPEIIYPINYGYIEGILAPDDEEQDVYVLGVDEPVTTFKGRIIAVVYRENDIENKWVAAPDGVYFTAEEIAAAVHFQEQFYKSHITNLIEAPK